MRLDHLMASIRISMLQKATIMRGDREARDRSSEAKKSTSTTTAQKKLSPVASGSALEVKKEEVKKEEEVKHEEKEPEYNPFAEFKPNESGSFSMNSKE